MHIVYDALKRNAEIKDDIVFVPLLNQENHVVAPSAFYQALVDTNWHFVCELPVRIADEY
jgi:hypothetical protein